MTSAHTRPAAVTKPMDAAMGTKPAAERVFVSPRVVDEQAFREFSGELRSLLDEIRREQEKLETASGAAATTASGLSASQDKYRQHLELTTRLLKALTAKSAEVEQALLRVDERLEAASHAERTASEGLGEKLASFERTIDERITSAEAAFDQRLAAIEQSFEARRHEIEGKWEQFKGSMKEQIESHRVFVQTGISAQADEVETMLRERAESLTGEIGSRLTAEREHAEEMAQRLASLRDEFRSETGEPLENTLEQIRTACTIATKLVGWDPADAGASPDAPTQGSLGELVLQATKAREDAEWSIRRLSSVREQAQTVISELGESLDGSMALFDQLIARRHTLNTEIGAVLDRADASQRSLEARQEEIQELVSPLADSIGRAESLSRELCSIADGSADLVTHAGIVSTDLAAVVESAQGMAEALGPWKRLLLDAEIGSGLPGPLAEIVDRFEREIGRDLAKMASAMQMMAQRAETAFRAPTEPGGSPEIVIRPRSTAELAADGAGSLDQR